jgi:hypothetical protein
MSPVPYILVRAERARCYSCLAAPNTAVFHCWCIIVTLVALGYFESQLAATATSDDQPCGWCTGLVVGSQLASYSCAYGSGRHTFDLCKGGDRCCARAGCTLGWPLACCILQRSAEMLQSWIWCLVMLIAAARACKCQALCVSCGYIYPRTLISR